LVHLAGCRRRDSDHTVKNSSNAQVGEQRKTTNIAFTFPAV
jgi:hypothetical protein